MDTVQVSARPRVAYPVITGKVAGKVRRAGFLPAVIYGNGLGTHAIAVDPKPVRRGLQSAFGRNQLFTVQLEGKEHLAICKEIQLDPVKRTLRHVDFFAVTPASPIVVSLQVTLSGRSVGQKAGGRLVHHTRYVQVSCTPTTLPKIIDIDVTPFDNGTVMTIENMPLPQGVTAVYKKAFKIFELFAPKLEEKVEADAKTAAKK